MDRHDRAATEVRQRKTKRQRKMVHRKAATGSVLVGLLWCVALLSVVVIGVLHTARLDSMVVKNYGDRIQARYLALAGVPTTIVFGLRRETGGELKGHA